MLWVINNETQMILWFGLGMTRWLTLVHATLHSDGTVEFVRVSNNIAVAMMIHSNKCGCVLDSIGTYKIKRRHIAKKCDTANERNPNC